MDIETILVNAMREEMSQYRIDFQDCETKEEQDEAKMQFCKDIVSQLLAILNRNEKNN